MESQYKLKEKKSSTTDVDASKQVNPFDQLNDLRKQSAAEADAKHDSGDEKGWMSQASDYAASKYSEAKENKVATAVTAMSGVNSTVAASLNLAGHTAASAMESGIGGAVIGAISAGQGGIQAGKNWQESSRLKTDIEGKPKKGEEGYSAAERAALRLQKQDADDATVRGASKAVSGALKTAGGITAATGVAAPIGMALGAAGSAVDGATMLGGMAVQSKRDTAARRMRDDDQILADKTEKNKERQKKVEGTIFNPMNWYAKASNSWNSDDPEKKIGLDDGFTAEQTEQRNKNYLDRKHAMYKDEGYDIEREKDGKIHGDIKKKTKSWFPWRQESTTTYDEEEQIYTKGLSSKATASRLEEKKKAEKEKKEQNKGGGSFWPF